MTIVTNVTCKKCKKMCNGEEAMMEYYINNSVYGLFHMSSLPPPFPDLLIKPKLLKVIYILHMLGLSFKIF